MAAAKQYLPELSSGFNDPRVTIHHLDGIEYIAGCQNEYDVLIIDSSDPVGPAVGLFQSQFYRQAARALKDDGIFVAQTESPGLISDLPCRKSTTTLKQPFP